MKLLNSLHYDFITSTQSILVLYCTVITLFYVLDVNILEMIITEVLGDIYSQVVAKP